MMQQAGKMFKAVRVAVPGPPSVLKVESIPMLTIRNPTDVILRVQAIGVNPVETYIRSGNYARPPDSFPFTPGSDASGIVMEVGSLVSHVKPGDRVYILRSVTGSYAEYTLAESKYVRGIPNPTSHDSSSSSSSSSSSKGGVSFAQAAAVGVPYFTAYRALFKKCKIRPGSTVFVHGATGGVGIACLQIAKRHACRVIGSAGSDAGAAAISPYCDVVVRHGSASTASTGSTGSSNTPTTTPVAENIVDQVLEATNGKGADSIIEMLANVNFGTDFRMLAKDGTLAIVGSRGAVMEPVIPRDLMNREASVVGVMLWAATDDDFTESGAYIDAGLIDGSLKPVIGTVLKGLEKAPDSHEMVIAHPGGSNGKIVISLEE